MYQRGAVSCSDPLTVRFLDWGCQLLRPIVSFRFIFGLMYRKNYVFTFHMAYSAVTGHEINAGDIICLRKYAWSSLMIDVTAVIYGFKDPRQGGLGVSSTWGCQSIPIDSFGFIFGLLYRNNHFYVCLQS